MQTPALPSATVTQLLLQSRESGAHLPGQGWPAARGFPGWPLGQAAAPAPAGVPCAWGEQACTPNGGWAEGTAQGLHGCPGWVRDALTSTSPLGAPGCSPSILPCPRCLELSLPLPALTGMAPGVLGSQSGRGAALHRGPAKGNEAIFKCDISLLCN